MKTKENNEGIIEMPDLLLEDRQQEENTVKNANAIDEGDMISWLQEDNARKQKTIGQQREMLAMKDSIIAHLLRQAARVVCENRVLIGGVIINVY